MPEIPSDISYQGAPRALTNVRTPELGPVTGGLAKGLRRASENLYAEVERQDKLSYANAKSDFLIAQSKALESMDEDDFYDGKEEGEGHRDYARKQYDEAINNALGEARSQLTNGRDREAFDIEAKVQAEKGRVDAGKRGFTRESDEAIANANEKIKELRRAAVGSAPESRSTHIEAMQEEIDGLLDKGYIDKTQAQALREKATLDYSLGILGAMEPDDQVAMLRNPKGTVAEQIPADQRESLLKRAEGQRDADLIRAERAREIGQKELQRQVWDALEANEWNISAIPSDDWLDLDAERQNSLLGMAERQAKGQNPVDNKQLASRFDRLAAEDRNAFIAVDLEAHRHELSRETYARIEGMQNGLIAGREDAVLQRKQLQTNKQVVDGLLKSAEIDFSADASGNESAEVVAIRALASEALDNFIMAHKREPTNIEYGEAVSRIIAEKVAGWWVIDRRAHEIDEEDEVELIPPAELDLIDKAIERMPGWTKSNRSRYALYRQNLTLPRGMRLEDDVELIRPRKISVSDTDAPKPLASGLDVAAPIPGNG